MNTCSVITSSGNRCKRKGEYYLDGVFFCWQHEKNAAEYLYNTKRDLKGKVGSDLTRSGMEDLNNDMTTLQAVLLSMTNDLNPSRRCDGGYFLPESFFHTFTENNIALCSTLFQEIQVEYRQPPGAEDPRWSMVYHENSLAKKIRECDSRVVVIFLRLIFSSTMHHANVLIFDKNRREVERFEPHGHKSEMNSEGLNVFIKAELRRLVPTFEYFSPRTICPRYNLQENGDVALTPRCVENGGYCSVYSVLYSVSRVLFPEMGRNEIYLTLNSLVQDDTVFIRKFITYMEVYVVLYAKHRSIE